ncbi:MAG: MATE family efflux transporter [Bacteroidales bacterium]|jgi:putative MATE family efflux protein|nr:MATE family efflux transporter [Bacteroidales bacterium]
MTDNNIDLARKPIVPLLFQYALPAIIAMTASSLYNIIDRMFIGKGVDDMAISGLALTFPLMNLAVAFGTLVGAGASAMVSIRMGQQKRADAIHILGNALVLNVIIGVVFSALGLIFLNPLLYLFGATPSNITYARDFMQVVLLCNTFSHIFFGLNNIMRASGHPTKAMISVLITVVINVVLAPLFIFVFHWGIRGAAWATGISYISGMIWVLAHFASKKPYIHFLPAGFRLSKSIIKDIFSVGLSPFSIHVMSCLIAIIINLQLGTYGNRELGALGGELSIGAFGIINSVVGLIAMVVLGLTQGMQPIVGFNYGANQMERVKETLKITSFWATGISLFGFLVMQLFPYQIASIFTNNPRFADIIVQGTRINTCLFFLVGFQIVVSNFFQSIGHARTAIFLSLSRQAIFIIPFLFIFPYFMGLNGVWFSAAAADCTSCLTGCVVLLHFFRKRKA